MGLALWYVEGGFLLSRVYVRLLLLPLVSAFPEDL